VQGLAITKTIDEVIAYHSDGLHVGINDRQTDETESAMLNCCTAHKLKTVH
jgi:hypothetical protein